MVDVSEKAATDRAATATGFITMRPETLALVQRGGMKKGDVLAVAQVAGIQAAKHTASARSWEISASLVVVLPQSMPSQAGPA